MCFDNDNLNCDFNNVIEITNDEIEILTNLASKITADPTDEPELFCKQSKECSENVPRRSKTILQDFELYGNGEHLINYFGYNYNCNNYCTGGSYEVTIYGCEEFELRQYCYNYGENCSGITVIYGNNITEEQVIRNRLKISEGDYFELYQLKK